MIRKRLADESGSDGGNAGSGYRCCGAAGDRRFGGRGRNRPVPAAAGLDAARLDILSEDFFNRVIALEAEEPRAFETLRKLLTDQIKTSERTNLVCLEIPRGAGKGDARLHE